MTTGLMIGIGVLIYVLGLVIIPYIHGRMYPYHYTASDETYIAMAVWPLTAVVAILIGPIVMCFVAPRMLVEFVRDKTQEKYLRIAQARATLEENMDDMFDDAPGV